MHFVYTVNSQSSALHTHNNHRLMDLLSWAFVKNRTFRSYSLFLLRGATIHNRRRIIQIVKFPIPATMNTIKIYYVSLFSNWCHYTTHATATPCNNAFWFTLLRNQEFLHTPTHSWFHFYTKPIIILNFDSHLTHLIFKRNIFQVMFLHKIISSSIQLQPPSHHTRTNSHALLIIHNRHSHRELLIKSLIKIAD